MRRESFAKTGRILCIMVIALVLATMSLPQPNQAQGLIGNVITEMEVSLTGADNDRTAFQIVPGPPGVIRGRAQGELLFGIVAFLEDIPPIISPITGDVVGTPRQTQIIATVSAFTDSQDLYSLRLTRDQNVSLNLGFSGDGYHHLSADAAALALGLPYHLFPFSIVFPSDLDLLLLNARGQFIDGSFDAEGNGLCLLPWAFGAPPPFCDLNLVNSTESVTNVSLPRGRYIINVDQFYTNSVFLLTVTPDQNILTNELVQAWDSATDESYTLRVGTLGTVGQPPEAIEPIKSTIKFLAGFRPVTPISGAAAEYQLIDVLESGRYSFNAVVGRAQDKGGHLFLLRQGANSRQWIPVARSSVVQQGFESIANVQLQAGRYMLAYSGNGIRPFSKKHHYIVTVLNHADEVVGMHISEVVNLQAIRDRMQFIKNSIKVSPPK
ncbi:MAG: hypothetical protein RMM98_02855 [Acidobacteriota bacterium]|nr:hypothetical protein [Blastocatellia bacterium]MDW8238531.1 hypothetical protein [Acidobacteriota bacterium]